MEKIYDFTSGFNFWMVVAPAFIIGMLVLGAGQWSKKDGKIRKLYSSKKIDAAAAIMAVIFELMLLFESFADIVGLLDRVMMQSYLNWSVVVAPFVVILVGMTFYVLLYKIAEIASRARRNYLQKK